MRKQLFYIVLIWTCFLFVEAWMDAIIFYHIPNPEIGYINLWHTLKFLAWPLVAMTGVHLHRLYKQLEEDTWLPFIHIGILCILLAVYRWYVFNLFLGLWK